MSPNSCVKDQKIVLIIILLIPMQLIGKIRVGEYGDIIEQVKNKKNGSIIDYVTIYPQENADSKQKISRNGILIRQKNAKATILLCHGFMCDKYDVGFLRHLLSKGNLFNFMSFDFRAHGENSVSQCCTFGHDEAYDVITAAHFIKNHPHLKNKPLFVYAFSMGAVAAIEAQAKDNSLFKAMVLDCPFDSSENLIKKGLQNLKFSLFGYEFDVPGRSFLEKYAFHPYVQSLVKIILKAVANLNTYNIQTYVYPLHPAESIKKISIPCFFIHCKNDQIVPTQAVESVYKGAAGYKRLWLTNGRRHFDSFFYDPEIYTERVQKFFNQVMSGELFAKQKEKVVKDKDDPITAILKKKEENIKKGENNEASVS
ncbi:MAG: alpha/beta hydrolase [Candidatus Babeliales bacterium]